MGAATNSTVAKIMASVFPSANYPIVIWQFAKPPSEPSPIFYCFATLFNEIQRHKDEDKNHTKASYEELLQLLPHKWKLTHPESVMNKTAWYRYHISVQKNKSSYMLTHIENATSYKPLCCTGITQRAISTPLFIRFTLSCSSSDAATDGCQSEAIVRGWGVPPVVVSFMLFPVAGGLRGRERGSYRAREARQPASLAGYNEIWCAVPPSCRGAAAPLF